MSSEAVDHHHGVVVRVRKYGPLCRRWSALITVLSFLLGIAGWWLQAMTTSTPSEIQPAKSWNWKQISPTQSLVYHPCFDDFECARLEVPMDWRPSNQAETKSKVAVAVIRLPARVPVTDERWGGAVILNPGGPGGSGVNQVLTGGKSVQRIIDSPIDPSSNETIPSSAKPRYFDVVGFDPRGINNTTPQLSCFPNSYDRKIWKLQSDAEGILGTQDSSFAFKWARAIALGDGCSNAAENNEIGFFMNTPSVVEDITELIERTGEWRETQSVSLPRGIMDISQRTPLHQKKRWRRGQERLLFWGFSYGSTLGATFAAMHPNRTNLVVLDGVCDFDDYYHGGFGFLSNLRDTDRIIDKLAEYCHEAGAETCPLFTGKRPEDIKAYFDQLFELLKDRPLPVPASDSRGPEIITASDVKEMVRGSLYRPIVFSREMSHLLADISSGNGSAFADRKHGRRIPWSPPFDCNSTGTYIPECHLSGDHWAEAAVGIVCSDADSLWGVTPEQFKDYWRELRRQSRYLGDVWAEIRLSCIGWKLRPKWRYEGPIESDMSRPILWIGNTADPVTPVANAHKMAQRFKGSVVLQQDSEGHCSIAAPSLCTMKAIREYFQSGALPDPGTVCEADEKPFLGMTKDNGTYTEDDWGLLKAMQHLARAWV